MNHKNTTKDIAHSLVKGTFGSIPIVGSLASEIFGLLITPPLEKRRAEWMNDIAEKLSAIEKKQRIDFNDLQNNEQFVDVILQATTFALKTSEKNKINSFKNAVLNTASGLSPDKTKSQIFLNQLDKFTTWHILILDFINSPALWFKKAGKTPPNNMSGSIYSLILDAFPELRNQNDLLDIIWDDLKSAGFHKTSTLKSMMTGSGVLSDRTTLLGKEFIGFISNEYE